MLLRRSFTVCLSELDLSGTLWEVPSSPPEDDTEPYDVALCWEDDVPPVRADADQPLSSLRRCALAPRVPSKSTSILEGGEDGVGSSSSGGWW